MLTDTDKFTKAAGIGGKAPAFTQAAVDSREKMLPMIKMAAKSVFKLHQEEGDKTSIRVDTEGDSKADDNSQQESKKAEGGEESQQQPEDNKGNDETPQPPTQTRSASENGRDDLKNNENTQPQRESDTASNMPGDETRDSQPEPSREGGTRDEEANADLDQTHEEPESSPIRFIIEAGEAEVIDVKAK